MSRTGYSDVRAEPHELWAQRVVDVLAGRGYPARLLAPDGDHPDIAFTQPTGEAAFIDVKCPNGDNYAIKTAAVHLAMASPSVTLFIAESDERVHTVVSLLPRLISGPNRPTGNGSHTDWYLFKRGGGVPFDAFFAPRLSSVACHHLAEIDPAGLCVDCGRQVL